MTITRRTALTALALPALPSVGLARQAEPDPVIAAFAEWRAAHIAAREASEPTYKFVTCPPEIQAKADAAAELHFEAMERLIATRPTTIEGLALHLRALGYCSGFDARCQNLSPDPLNWSDDSFEQIDGYLYAYERLAIIGIWGAIGAAEALSQRAS